MKGGPKTRAGGSSAKDFLSDGLSRPSGQEILMRIVTALKIPAVLAETEAKRGDQQDDE